MKKPERSIFGRFESQANNHRLDELEGHLQLGMKEDALDLARQFLIRTSLNAKTFNAALDAILIQADRIKPWKPLVERAYTRLSKRDQRAVGSNMLSRPTGRTWIRRFGPQVPLACRQEGNA